MLSLVLVAAGPLIVNGHRKSSSWVMTMSEAAFVFKEDGICPVLQESLTLICIKIFIKAPTSS